MAIGSGLQASLGVSKETTYGTYVAPTKFFEFMNESLKKERSIVQGGGLAAGRFAQLGSQRVTANESGSGSWETSVPLAGFGVILQQLFGGTVVPAQQAATAAYLQTIPLVDTAGKSLTVQVGKPSTDGTVNPYSYLGGKITQAEFSCGKDEFLSAKLDMDFKQVVETQVLATPSYPTTTTAHNFSKMAVRIGSTVAGATNLAGVTKFTLTIGRKMKLDTYYANGSGLKNEPITNDYVDAKGVIEADFVAKADLADRWASGAGFSLVWEFVDALIATTYYSTIRFEIPLAYLDGETPGVSGPDVVAGSFPFTIQSDGTNPIVTVKYTSTDVTV